MSFGREPARDAIAKKRPSNAPTHHGAITPHPMASSVGEFAGFNDGTAHQILHGGKDAYPCGELVMHDAVKDRRKDATSHNFQ